MHLISQTCALLFEAALHIDRAAFCASWRGVFLRVPGVLIGTAIIATLMVLAGHLIGAGRILDWRLRRHYALLVRA